MKIIKTILHFFFPPKCAACNNLIPSDETFCLTCLPEVPFADGRTCNICGIPIGYTSETEICERCLRMRPAFNKNISLFEHKGAGRAAVLNMKYNSIAVTAELGKLLAKRIAEESFHIDEITFIPQTVKEEKKKRKNIPYMLAVSLSKELRLPLRESLVKVRETQKQKGLSATDRKKNVAGAYRACCELKGKSILLLDDVFTTGSTMNECAKMLKKKGASSVYTATITIRDRV